MDEIIELEAKESPSETRWVPFLSYAMHTYKALITSNRLCAVALNGYIHRLIGPSWSNFTKKQIERTKFGPIHTVAVLQSFA